MNIKKWFRKDILIFTIGIVLVCYPIVSNYIESRNNSESISTYDKYVEDLSSAKKKEMIKQAERFNERLYRQQKGISVESELNYTDILNAGNGVIGSIEIPQIKINLPIYHGTDDSVLNIGAGHVEDSSMPIGGENTHAVITGHSGLPSNKLFTRLDELKEKERFYIRVLDKTLAYEIDKIEVVLPEKVNYAVEDGKDLATLVTCTPYGVNTHRLLVTGHRVSYHEDIKNKVKQKLPSNHELVIYLIPIVFIMLGIIIFRKKGAKKYD
ncbi:hypothetical protein IMSAGC017_01952 [Thomasclavelia cocleata]|uniref:Sortase A n=1 Tax=Thomasclavelia cocleata TaxID=69824 RepID=A0A829ZCX5_9FIRM|nr:class C sortase [Thomasclavelia cocleata]GFI41906.1 hypothetical protein IMSAGC017_01952 [Thomasclavelia cocleata]